MFESFIYIILGWFLGIVTHAVFILIKNRRGDKVEPRSLERIILLFLVGSIWFTANAVDIVTQGYEASPYLHAIFGAVIGFYFDINPLSYFNNKK
jgi:hypothetical protein